MKQTVNSRPKLIHKIYSGRRSRTFSPPQRLRLAIHPPHGQESHRRRRDPASYLSGSRISNREHRLGTRHASSSDQQETESISQRNPYHRERRTSQRSGYLHMCCAQCPGIQRKRNSRSPSNGWVLSLLFFTITSWFDVERGSMIIRGNKNENTSELCYIMNRYRELSMINISAVLIFFY